MSAIFAEDLDVFFDEFAVEVELNGETFQSIYNTPTDSISFENVGVEADKPWIRCKTSDLTGAKRNDDIVVDGVDYKIAKIRLEGSGTSIVWLATA